MVQIHEAPQSFGSSLIQSLAAAGVETAKGIQQRQANQALNKLHEEARRQNQIDPATGEAVTQPVTPAQKQVNTAQIYNAARNAGKSHEQALIEIQPYQEQNKIYAQEESKLRLAKEQERLKEEQSKKQDAKDFKAYTGVTKHLRELVPYAGSQLGTKTIGGIYRRETVRKRAEIDSLAIDLEGFFRDKATKGQLSQRVFDTLLAKIPKSTDSEAEYLGKLDGIDKILKLHLGENFEKEKKPELTPDIANQIFDQAGGNVAEAERIAKEMGYSW